jgi:hypothetical protein
MEVKKIIIKKSIKHINRAIKSRETKSDKKSNWIKYQWMKLKKIKTLKNIKRQINNSPNPFYLR